MQRIILLIFLFAKIFSYDKANLDIFKSLTSICDNCFPYRLKLSSDGKIIISIPSLYNSKNSRIGNNTNFSFVIFDEDNDKFQPFLKNYEINSVMGYYIDKNNKYYILDQGKISNNDYIVEKNTAKLIVYDSNSEKSKEYNFRRFDLSNSILTDVVVDHEGKYAYITDSGNLLKNESIPGIIVYIGSRI